MALLSENRFQVCLLNLTS